MTTINDTDLFLVNRGGVDYKITAQELKEYLTAVPSPPGTSMPWEGHDGGVWHVNNLGQVPVLLGPEGSSFDSWSVDGSDQRSISQLEIGEERVIVSPPHQENMFGNDDKGRRNTDAEFEFGSYTDTSRVTNLEGCFTYCSKFNGSLGGNWDTSNVTNMAFMFNEAQAFNQDISGWNTGKVTSMYYMFFNDLYFDQDISGWDTSNVINMSTLFRYCEAFNADISQWNVGKVTDMNSMFTRAKKFNQDLSNWCVTNLTEPLWFDDQTDAWTKPRPCWGHCPRGENGTVDPCPSGATPWEGAETIWHVIQDKGSQIRVWNYDKIYYRDTGEEKILGEEAENEIWPVGEYIVTGTRTKFNDAGGDFRFGELTDFSKVTDMSYMFDGTNLTADISNWDVSNVTNMRCMFKNASEFNSDISGWDTSNVREMDGMFSETRNFDQDISGWDTTNVAVMDGMFYEARAFNQDLSDWCVFNILSEPDGFDERADAWTKPRPCWGHCPPKGYPCPVMPWEGHDGGIWHIKNVQNERMRLDRGNTFFTGWDVNGSNERGFRDIEVGEEVVFVSGADCKELFYNAGVTTWEFGEFTDTSKVTNMTKMLDLATAFNADISGWDTSNVLSMEKMFLNAKAFNQDISGWDTSNVRSMANMFNDADAFNQDISSWDTSNVLSMEYMFSSAYAFNQDISGWDVSKVTNMEYMFYYAFAFNQDIGGWDTSNVTNMQYMFSSAQSFNQDIGSWDTSNVADMKFLFNSALDFDQDISSWDVKYITSKPRYFDRNAAFQGQTAKQPQWDASSSAMPWEGHDGGIWHIKNSNQQVRFYQGNYLLQEPCQAWTVDGTDLGLIHTMEAGEEIVFVTGADVKELFSGSIDQNGAAQKTANWDFGEHTDTSKVTSMHSLFEYCEAFNGELGGNWDTSNVTNMHSMFHNAWYFNQDISDWDVSNVLTFKMMFDRAEIFNQDISKWNTGKCEKYGMDYMFNRAKLFNQNLTEWCVDFQDFEPVSFAWRTWSTYSQPKWGSCPRGESNA